MLAQTQVIQETSSFVNKIIEMGYEFVPKLIGAILVYLIGSWIISWVVKLTGKTLENKKFDLSLAKFLMSFLKVMLTILLLLTVIGMLGINTTSFAAILAGAGLAIGAALNGSLGNLAGGVMMLIFKPFKVGDMIDAQGNVGVVKELGIFNTTIISAENKTIFLPNGALSTGVITNLTTHGNLRVDFSMAIDPAMDIDKVRKIAIDTMLNHPKVLKEPMPSVNVQRVGDGMVTLAFQPYAKQEDYWNVFFGVQEMMKNAFDKNEISGPIPHRVIISK